MKRRNNEFLGANLLTERQVNCDVTCFRASCARPLRTNHTAHLYLIRHFQHSHTHREQQQQDPRWRARALRVLRWRDPERHQSPVSALEALCLPEDEFEDGLNF